MKARVLLIVSAIITSACGVSGNYRGSGPCQGFHKDPHACERAYENSLVATKIKIGQSLGEVRAIMGRDPERRTVNTESETWSYLTDYDHEILMVIVFKQGSVTEIKQASSSESGA